MFFAETEHSNNSNSNTVGSHRRPTSVFLIENRKSSDPCSPSECDKHLHLSPAHFQYGRAEALGALCR